MPSRKIIRTNINEKYLDDEGILRINVLEGAHITLEALKDDAANNFELTDNKKALAIYDSRAFFTIEPDAREYVKSGIIDPTRLATAVLTNRLAVNILVNFFIRFNKPKTPMKLFTKEEDALIWLRAIGKELEAKEKEVQAL